MAVPEAPSGAAPASGGPRHGLRIFLIWIVLALASDLVIWFVWYPHLPPGDLTSSARHQQFDIAVLAITGTPVMMLVWVYFGYAIVVWRRRAGDDTDGPPIVGRTGIQATWIIATSIVVLWLFGFGTYELIVPAGAGAGEGPSPVWKLSGTTSSTWSPGSNDILQVQAIGQQWNWTFRYPQYGGFESTQLLLPSNTPIEFHVTSLDVIHSFWAYLLGVKADANPGVDNVAYTKTTSKMDRFVYRCNELCGIWHGAMYDYGRIVTPAAFQTWATGTQAAELKAGILTALPRYSLTYDPTVIPQLGKALVKIVGVTGAPGYYYPPTDPVTP
jgi:cytochrome c oxidase subunit 2